MLSSSHFEPWWKTEKPEFWMWTNRKHNMNSTHFTLPKSYNDSWEEQAFAEDAAGHLGGCIWPPRSYSCSFCKREFRSAQALGGHMNVHRRDRARLKQSTSSHPQNEIHNNSNNPSGSLGFHQYPSHHQLCSFVYNPNPNSDPVVVASPSRVSLLTLHTQKNCPENTFIIPSLSSPFLQEQQHNRSPISSPKSRIVESASTVKADYVKTDVCVSLNLGVRRTRPAFSDYDHKDHEANGCKRRRTEASSIHLQSEEHKVNNNPSSIEELDLELRLGDPPKESYTRDATIFVKKIPPLSNI